MGWQKINKEFKKNIWKIIQKEQSVQIDEKIKQDLIEKLVRIGQGNEENYEQEIDEILFRIENIVEKLIINKRDEEIRIIEEVLIGMLGHKILRIKERGVILLNIIYDEVDWQLKQSYSPVIKQVEEKWDIEYLIRREEVEGKLGIAVMVARQVNKGTKRAVEWHPVILSPFDSHYLIVKLDLGIFNACGYYDWKLVALNTNGQITSVSKIYDLINSNSLKKVQGRFIVHPVCSNQLQIHEVFVDLANQFPEDEQQCQRGDFKILKQELCNYKKEGINCLYLMGALERDNQYYKDKNGMYRFENKDAPPLGCTDRDKVCLMLGGEYGFEMLMEESRKLKMGIIVDAFLRVSSRRCNRKYREQFVYYLDSKGQMQISYGNDGRSNDYDDTILLNYRKKHNWDLLLQELIVLSEKYIINGVHLDNGSNWPLIKEIDYKEMYRLDTDGEPAYSIQQIFEGVIVQQDQESGYYSVSQSVLNYANPFMVKLCKELWRVNKQFLIIAEVWNAKGSDDRQASLIKSGTIPREYQLPIILSSIFGQQLHRDGSITQIKKQNVNIFKSYYKHTRNLWPKGSLIVQSSTSHCWPYPALLYKRGAWAAVDVLFFLNDIPITFLQETHGKAYRQKTTNIFTKFQSNSVTTLNTLDDTQSRVNDSQNRIHDIHNSSINMDIQKYKEQLENTESSNYVEIRGYTGQLYKVASGVSLSELSKEQIRIYQKNLNKELGPEYGFDLSQIQRHYNHRRMLRSHKEVLTKGQFIELQGEHDHGWHQQVLVFGRHYEDQIAVIAINFNDSPVHCYLDLQNINFLFSNSDSHNIVLQLEDWTNWNPDNVSPQYDYYFLSELINEKQYIYIQPYSTQIWGIHIHQNNQHLIQLATQKSIIRLKKKINKQETIQANEIALIITQLIQNTNDIQTFINGFSWFHKEIILKNDLNLIKLLVQIKDIKENQLVSSKMQAMFSLMLGQEKIEEVIEKEGIEEILKMNKMKEISFVCPEIGRWSTVGGLGVMVNELSEGLAAMGEKISVVSPYYDKNRKGQQNYLEQDKECNFSFILTLEVFVGGVKYKCGVHKGTVKNVDLYFIHNFDVFPYIYADGDSQFTLKQMAVFAKATLELYCQLRNIPQIVVTNDWFTGLVSAYAKNKNFSTAFDNTKFFHIVHNLDKEYEGRLYLSPQDDNLHWIHQLPNEWLIDPYWQQKVINPSRCALMTTDNWGTVSQSYKQDLLRESSLANLLAKFQKSFAFPNGINKKQRLQRLKDLCNNDHYKAKELLQQKYFKFKNIDDSICLFAFVGRITEQKGVHLILESMDQLVHQYNAKIQILIGGMANPKDPYGIYCINLMFNLKNKYPHSFWADPYQFFTDGPLVNLGADYGLMPSLFEPCGIVQQEFFVAGTPVLAFKTGGLKDTVKEFETSTLKGNGVNFEAHKTFDLIFAIKRAFDIFQNKKLYHIIRDNSFESVIDLEDVSKAWLRQFYQTCNKIYVDKETENNFKDQIEKNWNIHNYKMTSLEQKKEKGKLKTDDEKRSDFYYSLLAAKSQQNLRSQVMTFVSDKMPRPKQIFIIGSWDDWSKEIALQYDHYHQHYSNSLLLKPGEYYYKFIIDGEWICSQDHPKNNDLFGNINNYLVLK